MSKKIKIAEQYLIQDDNGKIKIVTETILEPECDKILEICGGEKTESEKKELNNSIETAKKVLNKYKLKPKTCDELLAEQKQFFEGILSFYKKKIKVLETKILKLEDKVTLLVAENKRLKAENSKLKAENSKLKAEISRLKAIIDKKR